MLVKNESSDKKKLNFYTQTRLGRCCFWAKNHPGEMIFTSGFLVMGIAMALIFGVGGNAAIAGLFLVLLAGVLLCGKAAFPESNGDEISYGLYHRLNF